MEVGLTTLDAIGLLGAEPKLAVALLGILILVAALSRQLLFFLGSGLLAVIAFLIFEFPCSLSTILIIAFAAGTGHSQSWGIAMIDLLVFAFIGLSCLSAMRLPGKPSQNLG